MSLPLKMWFAVAGRWSGCGVEMLRVFSCQCSWRHRHWCPGRWLPSPRRFGPGQSRCPGGLWGCWSDRGSGSGRCSREMRPPPPGTGAWAGPTGTLVGQELCSRRRTCSAGRRIRSRCGSLCGCCAERGIHPASTHWVLKADQPLLWLDACKSHWYEKEHRLLAQEVKRFINAPLVSLHLCINYHKKNKQMLPDACWCAYFIGKDIFNHTFAGLFWGLLNNNLLHHLSVECKISSHKLKLYVDRHYWANWKNATHFGLSSAAGSDGDRSFPSAPHRLLHHRNWFWFGGSNLLWRSLSNNRTKKDEYNVLFT